MVVHAVSRPRFLLNIAACSFLLLVTLTIPFIREHVYLLDTYTNDIRSSSRLEGSAVVERPEYCPNDLTDEQCRAMVPPHTKHKTVLVTGGAGFIGSHVAEFLLSRGDHVVIVDEMNNAYDVKIKENNLKLLRDKYPSKSRLSVYRGDICNVTLMQQIFEAQSIKWVCHMAARAGVRPSIKNPFPYIESNIKGTATLMELSHKHRVQNFVFASSSSVYGGSNSTFFSEQENVDGPISPYAASKKAAELFSYTYRHLHDLNITALRFFTVYGPRGRPDMAPYMFIDRVSRGKKIQQFGDGSSSRDYTYISDIVDGVVRALDRPHKYEIINLGKGSGTSLKDFIHVVEKYTGKKAAIEVLPSQPGDVPRTCANVTKAHLLLGYESKVPIDEGIRQTVKWYKETYVTTAKRPLLPPNATGHAFVCITGQAARFVPSKIVETMLDPLKHQGYDVEVALIMSESAYSRRPVKSGQFESYRAAHDYLVSKGIHVVTNASITQQSDPTIPPNYLAMLDDKITDDEGRRERVKRNARMMDTLAMCHDALRQRYTTLGLLARSGGQDDTARVDYYDFAIRMREDVSLEKPLRMKTILPLLYPESSAATETSGTVLASDCRTHGGINDRMAVVSREAFQDYFQGPWRYFTEADADLNSATAFNHKKVHNSESFYYYVYKNLNLNVVRSHKLRGLVKYEYEGKGDEDHAALPAVTEENSGCPKLPSDK